MDIYLVRHGQTDGNLAKRHQHRDTPLNDTGIAQAKATAAIFANQTITHIVSSRQKRALQTAEIIGQQIDIIPETYEVFEEIYRPEYLVGDSRTGWKVWRYMALWYLDYEPASMHSGETYTDFRQRIRAGRTHLESYPLDSSIVVVSHGAFIAFFVAYLKRDTKLNFLQTAWLFLVMIFMRNTSVRHLSYDGTRWRRHYFT